MTIQGWINAASRPASPACASQQRAETPDSSTGFLPWLDDPRRRCSAYSDARWLVKGSKSALGADVGCAAQPIAGRMWESLGRDWLQSPSQLVATLFARNRSLVLVGDSGLMQQFRSLVCTLQAVPGVVELAGAHDTPVPACDMSSSAWGLAGSLNTLHVCLRAASFLAAEPGGGGSDRPVERGTVTDAVEPQVEAAIFPRLSPPLVDATDGAAGSAPETTRRDGPRAARASTVVFVGVGAFYNARPQAGTRNLSSYAAELAALPHWWGSLRRRWREQQSIGNGSGGGGGVGELQLVLRDPLPQHFDSGPHLHGLFDVSVMRAVGARAIVKHHQATAQAADNRSDASYGRGPCGGEDSELGCVAHGAGVDARLAAFDVAVHEHPPTELHRHNHIAVARVHEALAPLWYAHRGFDCAHFCAPAVYLHNVEMVRQIALLDAAASKNRRV